MNNTDTNTLRSSIEEVLDSMGFIKNVDGIYENEVTEHWKNLSTTQLDEILSDNEPYSKFYQIVCDNYEDAVVDTSDQLFYDVLKELHNSGKIEQEDNEDLNEDIRDILYDLVTYNYPINSLLDEPYNVDIILDTKDSLSDFTLNTPESNEFAPTSSLLWLAKQQGYTKEQLQNAVFNEDPHLKLRDFLCSCRNEVKNCTTSSNAVTFLGMMTLRDLIDLNILIRKSNKTLSCSNLGYVKVSKFAVTGLCDIWNGAGGPFDILLDKNVCIPIRYIHLAMPDGTRHYSVKEIYGMLDSVWNAPIRLIKDTDLDS